MRVMCHFKMLMWTLIFMLQYNNSLAEKSEEDIIDAECGGVDIESIASYLEFRVTGGNDILINQSPWTAILELSSKQNEDRVEVLCGGSLISPTLITTAAHCLWGNTNGGMECPEQLRSTKTPEECHNRVGGCPIGCRRLRPQDINIYLGITSVTKQNRRPLSVEAIYIHELWDKSKLLDRKNVLSGNDIALLQLSEKQSFTAKIKPVCLPDLELQAREATFDGFGSVRRGTRRENAQRLQRGIIQISTKDVCNSAYKITLSGNQLCGGTNGVDSCRGDSGGGLTTIIDEHPNEKHVLIGIASFGSISCGDDIHPGVYTNVLSHKDWIQTRVGRSTETWGPWTPCSATCGPGVMERRSSKCNKDSQDYDIRSSSDIESDIFYDYGDSSDANCLDTKECFNRPCQEKSIIPEIRNNIGRILLVGGYVGAAKQSNKVFLQDCHYNTFEDFKVPSFPVNISLSSGQVLGDSVYICGGFNRRFESQRDCFKFTFRPGEQWEEGPSLITPRANAAMISTKTGLWITGGRNGPINFLDSTEFLQKSSGAWINGPLLTQKLGLHCALADESSNSERMIIIGGTRFDDRSEDFIRTDIVESYDLSTNQSTLMPSLQTPRSGHSCLLIPGDIFDPYDYEILVAGGKTSRRERLNIVEYFQAGASRWVYIEPLPFYFSGASFVMQNSLPLLIGGITS